MKLYLLKTKYLNIPIIGFIVTSLLSCNISFNLRKKAAEPNQKNVVLIKDYETQRTLGTGFFVEGEKNLCSVMTLSDVVKKAEKISIEGFDSFAPYKLITVSKSEEDESTIDLITFEKQESISCPAMTIKVDAQINNGDEIQILGYGKESEYTNLFKSQLSILGSSFTYQDIRAQGMDGSPIIDKKNNNVIAIQEPTDIAKNGVFKLELFNNKIPSRQTSDEWKQRCESDYKTNKKEATFSCEVAVKIDTKNYYEWEIKAKYHDKLAKDCKQNTFCNEKENNLALKAWKEVFDILNDKKNEEETLYLNSLLQIITISSEISEWSDGLDWCNPSKLQSIESTDNRRKFKNIRRECWNIAKELTDDLKEVKNILETENDNLKVERNELETENDNLKLERNELETENDNLKLERNELETENDNLKLERDELIRQLRKNFQI